MNVTTHVDLAVIGAGAAGSTAAKMAVRQGLRVALIERDQLGGTCLNYGCDPTKFLLHAAQMRRRCATLGRPDHGRIAPIDWSDLIQKVRGLIARVRGGSHAEAVARQEQRGIDVILGSARFTGNHVLTVAERQITADQILIAVGYDNVLPPIPGLADAPWITNRQAVNLDPLPNRIAVLGAGPVGVEFAQIFSRFGAEVTLIESGPRILLKDDAEAATLLQSLLEREGIRVECGATIVRIDRDSNTARIHWTRGNPEEALDTDCILIAAGRGPDLETLHLDAAGIETKDGRLVVRDTLQTSVPHIWAAGDITGTAPFTHVASAQAKHVLTHLYDATPPAFDARAIPWATYTFPALAHVGQTEEQLNAAGIAYRTLKVDFREITRNVLTDQEEGVYKILVDDAGTILGAHILANHADELVAPIVVAMRHQLTVQQIADTILPYPTMSEAMTWAAAKFEGPLAVPADVECSVRPCKDDHPQP